MITSTSDMLKCFVVAFYKYRIYYETLSVIVETLSKCYELSTNVFKPHTLHLENAYFYIILTDAQNTRQQVVSLCPLHFTSFHSNLMQYWLHASEDGKKYLLPLTFLFHGITSQCNLLPHVSPLCVV